jgi:glycosyltransferase involved in cell wall biosynthesis
MDTNDRPLNLLLIHFDWRNIFENDPNELREKLIRDRFVPEKNHIFSFAWSTLSYEKQKEGMDSIHVKTHWRFFRPFLDVASMIRVPLWVRRRNLSLDAVCVYDFGLLPAAAIVSRITGAKVVMFINNMPTIYSHTRRWGTIKGFYSWCIERLFWRLADRIFTINPAMVTYLKDIGIPEERIRMFAMNTIERDAAFITESKKGVIRKQYGLANDAKIMVTVARLEAEKDHERLLTLFSTLPDTWHLFLLGDGSLKESLMQQAATLGIGSRVHFEGFVKRSMIWNYYQDADVFVLLSKAEALGVVFWEAMYLNVPVIGSMAEGIVESIGMNEERARLLRSDEGAAAFVTAVNECVDESPERAAMLRAAKDYVDEQIAESLTINDVVATL